MSTTYKLLLWKPLASGLRKVKLRVTVARAQEYLETGVELAPEYWNEKADPLRANWVRATHPDNKLLNGRLREIWREVQSLALSAAPLPAKEIKRQVESRFGLGRNAAGVLLLLGAKGEGSDPGSEDFLAYFAEELTRRRASGNPRSVEKLDGILGRLQAYVAPPRPLAQPDHERAQVLAAQKLPWSLLTARWLRDYADHLARLGNKESTVVHTLTFIKTIVRRAIEDDKLAEAHNPFKRLRLQDPAPAPKLKLTAEQVAVMESLDLPAPTRGLRRMTNTQLAREAWLLQYFLLGARVGDALTLRWSAVGPDMVQFQEQKTGKWKYAPRHARLDAVLIRLSRLTPQQPPHPDDFVLPLLDRGAPYAQYPSARDWKQLSQLPEFRDIWLQLLRRVESATSALNAGLKGLAPYLGLDPKDLSTHTARHSFANAGRIAGLPAAYMRDLLNHHSIGQTEIYMGQLGQGEGLDVARRIYGA